MRAFSIPALATSVLAAPPALAACPVAADLETGIRIVFEDDVVIEYTAAGPGIVDEAEINPADGSRYHIVTERGILETGSYSRIGNGKKVTNRIRYEYDFDTAAVFPLEPGKTGGGKQTSFNAKGDVVDESFVGYAFGAPESFSAGGCSYDAVPVQINMRFAKDPMLVIRLAYLPELDFAVISGYYEWGYDPLLFVPVSMEPIEKN